MPRPHVGQCPVRAGNGKQRPHGFTAASDHLRVELVHRFGGCYADGDLAPPDDHAEPATLPDLFTRVAPSVPDSHCGQYPAKEWATT